VFSCDDGRVNVNEILPRDRVPQHDDSSETLPQTLSVFEPGHDTRIERAEARTEQAEARTEQARTRTEQAESRTEQAETRTEQAKTRTEQAELRMEQAETRNEEAIRVSELNYRRLFEAAKDGILILEAQTGRITEANHFLIELLGFSLPEMVGKTTEELSPFKDLESNKIMLERLKKDGFVCYAHLLLETRSGRKVAVEFVSNVYRAGSCEMIQCNIRDITRRREAEDRLTNLKAELEQRVVERTAELQIANEELEAFSYSVSHDLRAPLRHILGFIKLLERDAGPALTGKSLGCLTTISEATKRMGKLIDDLLDFSHAGRVEMQKSEVDLNRLAAETVADFQAETLKRKIAWNVHVLPTVRGDCDLLRMVVVNLVSNAVKFTGARAEPKIEIGCAPGGDEETVIFIRDNGAGFDPNYAEKLFGVFQRLHSREEFEGTGIGLANVQRIVRRHGGRTWAEGIVEGGATFYFSIPNPTKE
jgi:PAS domain S-box-containing protein